MAEANIETAAANPKVRSNVVELLRTATADTPQFGPHIGYTLFLYRATLSAHFGTMETFAKNLRRRAEELGVSNAEIARRLGVSERRYAHYTRGDREPDLATLKRIAAVFQTSTDELLGRVEHPLKSERDVLRERLVAAVEILSDRDFQLLLATTEAAAKFVRSEQAERAEA